MLNISREAKMNRAIRSLKEIDPATFAVVTAAIGQMLAARAQGSTTQFDPHLLSHPPPPPHKWDLNYY